MKIVITIFAFLACSALNAQTLIDDRTDLQKQELKGRVKSIKIYTINEVKYLTVDELNEFQRQGLKPPYYKREWKQTIDFNTNGYITESRDPNGWDSYDNTYGQDGRLLATTSYDADGNVDNVYSFKYDSRGYITSAVRKSQDKVYFTESYTCDDNGRLLYMNHDFLDGRIEESTFEYVDGKISKWVESLNGEPKMTLYFDGSMAYSTDMYYWQDGTCLHRCTNYNDKKLPVTVSSETASGKQYVCIMRFFDDHDNVVKEITYNEDGSISNTKTFEYEYDAQGNWTHRIRKGYKYFDNETRDREIEYY